MDRELRATISEALELIKYIRKSNKSIINVCQGVKAELIPDEGLINNQCEVPSLDGSLEKDFECSAYVIDSNNSSCNYSELSNNKVDLNTREGHICDECIASLVNFHKKCDVCKYDLCLACYQEFWEWSQTRGDSTK